MSFDKVAARYAQDWFTIAPRYRTKQRLAALISDAINYAQIAEMIEDNGSLDDAGIDATPTVEIVYMPRSEWPKSVTDVFDMSRVRFPR